MRSGHTNAAMQTAVPYESGDADCSGAADIDNDDVDLINFIFSGGNAPSDIDGDVVSDC